MSEILTPDHLTAHRIRAPSSPCPLPAAVALPPPSMGTARRTRTQRPGNRKSPLAIFPLLLTFVSPNPKLPNPSERAVTDLGEAMVCREGVDRTPECQVCRILGWAATGQPCGGRAAGGCAWRRRPSEERRAQAATDLRPGLAGSGVARLCTICQARAARGRRSCTVSRQVSVNIVSDFAGNNCHGYVFP